MRRRAAGARARGGFGAEKLSSEGPPRAAAAACTALAGAPSDRAVSMRRPRQPRKGRPMISMDPPCQWPASEQVRSPHASTSECSPTRSPSRAATKSDAAGGVRSGSLSGPRVLHACGRLIIWHWPARIMMALSSCPLAGRGRDSIPGPGPGPGRRWPSTGRRRSLAWPRARAASAGFSKLSQREVG